MKKSLCLLKESQLLNDTHLYTFFCLPYSKASDFSLSASIFPQERQHAEIYYITCWSQYNFHRLPFCLAMCVCECILGKKRNLNKTMLSYVCVCVDDSLGNYNTAEIKSSMKPCMNINIQFHNFSRLRAFSKHPIFSQLLNCFIRLQPV